MQKPEPKMSFVTPELRPLGGRTGGSDILHQPFDARRRAKPWCKTRNPMVVQKRMEF